MFIIFSYFSYEIASGSEITQSIKIDKPLVIYRFSGNVLTSTNNVVYIMTKSIHFYDRNDFRSNLMSNDK